MKLKIEKFWKEWGISKEEFGMIIGGFSVFGMIFALYFVCSILG